MLVPFTPSSLDLATDAGTLGSQSDNAIFARHLVVGPNFRLTHYPALQSLDMFRIPLDRTGVEPGSIGKTVEPQASVRGRPRILHVLASLGLGGVETWLMQMLRHGDLFSFDHELLLTKSEIGHYEEEAQRLGIRIHKLPLDRGKLAWLGAFRRFLKTEGPFAAVHSHVYLFSAAILSEAKRAGIPLRIAHCHTARSRGTDHRTIRHKLRRAAAVHWLQHVATRRIGISEAAIAEVSGHEWREDPANSVLIYGFDFSPFLGSERRARALRARLAIPEDAPVIGHVGRFDPVKNHRFLLEAFAHLRRNLASARLVLIGDGPTRNEIATLARSLGLLEQVHFAGLTDDVPAYMRMFDLLVLPSLSEGLGIVVVEAQAAGTRSIVSDAVPAETEVVPGAVKFVPLTAGPEAWSRAMAESLQCPRPRDGDWLEKVEQGRFAIDRCIAELDAIYRQEMARTR